MAVAHFCWFRQWMLGAILLQCRLKFQCNREIWSFVLCGCRGKSDICRDFQVDSRKENETTGRKTPQIRNPRWEREAVTAELPSSPPRKAPKTIFIFICPEQMRVHENECIYFLSVNCNIDGDFRPTSAGLHKAGLVWCGCPPLTRRNLSSPPIGSSLKIALACTVEIMLISATNDLVAFISNSHRELQIWGVSCADEGGKASMRAHPRSNGFC